MNKRTLTILLASALTFVAAVAQNPYDDLYYSPSKAAKEKQKKEAQLKQQQADAYRAQAAQYSDSYSAGSSMPLTVDVDTYNRRTDAGTAAIDTTASTGGDFSYTRRLERFHNPEIVAESGDNELIEYYYTSASQQPEVNIYLIDNNPYSWGWNSWGWNSPYYPWRYSYSWPSWSFGWGYDPWFDFSFGWGSPWYGPSWGWNWGWTVGPGWAPRPPHPGFHPGHGGHPGPGWAVNSPGASRPHRPYSGASSSAGKRPNYGARPGVVNSWNSYNKPNSTSTRPGNMGLPTTRPGSSSSVNNRPSTPSHSQSTGSSSSHDRRGSSPSYHNSSSSRSSSPSYRPSSGGSRGYSGGGGTRSTGGGGGGRGRR